MEKEWKKIRYIVVDVDGTLTDGTIYYDEHGNEWKKFHTRDAAGFFAAKRAGIEIIVLTGRTCAATQRRMEELNVPYLFQGVGDKHAFLLEFMQEHGISPNELVYIGDDVNDLAPMQLAGFVGCPKDACKEVLERADYASSKEGGKGAVRDMIEYCLKQRGEWDAWIGQIYGGI